MKGNNMSNVGEATHDKLSLLIDCMTRYYEAWQAGTIGADVLVGTYRNIKVIADAIPCVTGDMELQELFDKCVAVEKEVKDGRLCEPSGWVNGQG